MHLSVDVNTLTSGGNKRPPSIKQSWSENSSGLLKYAGPSAPTRNNNVKQESYLLITTKINYKSMNITFVKQRKQTSQTKHDSQNISGFVRLSDLVKTAAYQWFLSISFVTKTIFPCRTSHPKKFCSRNFCFIGRNFREHWQKNFITLSRFWSLRGGDLSESVKKENLWRKSFYGYGMKF